MAVAKLELISRTPTFANMAVNAAKKRQIVKRNIST